MLAAVIFDFDGIIVDTEPIHYRAFQEVLVPLGLGYPWTDYLDRYIGFDDRDAFREAFRARGESLSEDHLYQLIGEKARAFNRVISSGVEPYPGVVELILSLVETVPVALCSGALRSDIAPILQQLKLTNAFGVIVTADDVPTSKPDPASYRLALQRLISRFPDSSISAESSIAIEDTPAGIASARGAGLQVLGVTNSYPADKLSGACKVVETLAGIDYPELNSLLSRP
ncbi:HAD family phosphatase [Geobacter sp. DSM 9736]|uniref:HAD family hydrolase n=1 Tax=Geobacter sp. DSM 9736 TaxID=1277350 RepID=UPI000B509F82|nr:HAD family phosphatase [Geobacter sp. DSM 9736]SNB45569.1 haloacid dehalogenase superfamily, subfamily IA, variant 3 with third motif having DD or ED [Geobacter sp. DSM 9736]